jgi:hypothetical protein
MLIIARISQGYNLAMQTLLTTSPVYGVILWIILYTGDYYLTIHSARGFREIGHFQFEGSFELTPQYQKDIDALRPISKLHIMLLITYGVLIVFIWWLTSLYPFFQWLYLFYLGMLLLVEVAVHLRHLRNIFLIREVRNNGGMEGQISYQRWFTYQVSANELYLISALFLIVAILTYSTFFLGGALMCYGTGFKHARLARKTRLDAQATVPASPPHPEQTI